MNFLWGLAFLVAGYAIQAFMMKGSKPKPAAFDEFDFPQIDENTPQAVIFGDAWSDDWMVLWYGDYQTSPIKPKGGKGGAKK